MRPEEISVSEPEREIPEYVFPPASWENMTGKNPYKMNTDTESGMYTSYYPEMM